MIIYGTKKSNRNKISVYTRDGKNASSSYYRILQYINKLNFNNVKNRQFVPKCLTKALYNTNSVGGGSKIIKIMYHLSVYLSSNIFFLVDSIFVPDVVIILRGITPRTFKFPTTILYKNLLKRTKKVIWDFDDNIFLNHEISNGERDILLKYSTKIVVTHDKLMELLPENAFAKTICLTTTDGDYRKYDLNVINKERLKKYDEEIRLVWLASSSGLKDIPKIKKSLEKTAKKLQKVYDKKLKLIVVCNKPYNDKFEYLQVENIVWTREKAIEKVISAHIGIMPLINNEFAQGKGGFKLVQYMSIGLPSVASNVGFNSKVIRDNYNGYIIDDDISQDKWIDCITELSTSKSRWLEYSHNAYKTWLDDFSYDDHLVKWKELISN